MVENDIQSGSDGYGLLLKISLPFELPTSVYGAMLAIWHSRPDLQKHFPLHQGQPKQYLRFLAWCTTFGRKRYRLLNSLPEWDDELGQPIELPYIKNDIWTKTFSVDQYLCGVAKQHFNLTPILKSKSARRQAAISYWRGDRHKYNLPKPKGWRYQTLKESFSDFESFVKKLSFGQLRASTNINVYIDKYQLHDVRQYYLDSVDVSEKPSIVSLSKEIDQRGPKFSTPILKLSILRESKHQIPNQSQKKSVTSKILIKQRSFEDIKFPFGVNLYGYAQGEFGIGEDVRLVAKALNVHNIPFCIINIRPGNTVSQKDNSVDHWIVDQPKYAINLFCTTGTEQVTYACLLGMDHYHNRYNIGLWPWELPEWPGSCHHAYDAVDEIWGISQYTANAYRSTYKPVHTMSLPVEVDDIANLGRKDFNLPEKDYLFIFSFDFNSTLIRKNPEAVFQAFKLAFPNKAEKVGLVLKVSHAKKMNRQWKNLKKLIKADSRIHLIEQTLRRPEVLSLYRCCNCFVSLHRAEGFGRGIAEALLLDLQVIATGFSGNLDYCTDDRVGLVRYKLKKVAANEYFNSDGLEWAEPDIDHAAEIMREIYQKPKFISETNIDFSPKKTGKLYVERLNEIRKQLKI